MYVAAHVEQLKECLSLLMKFCSHGSVPLISTSARRLTEMGQPAARHNPPVY